MDAYTNFFEHYQEMILGHDPVPSPMPLDIVSNLRDILLSPVGDRVRKLVSDTGQKIKLVKSFDVSLAFQVDGDGNIYYSQDVSGWLETRKFAPQDSTLSSLIAHEIGHIYLMHFGPFLDIVSEEIYVTREFENAYREYAGLALRCSYFEDGDVC